MKLAKNPNCDWKLVASNCRAIITPIGLGKPVTKAIRKKSANIIAMGSTLFRLGAMAYIY